MHLTVLLATRNRAGILREVLESYVYLSGASPWKIVVVDNGSTDDTRDTVGAFASALPIKYLYEPQPGKTTALNSGIPEIEGDLTILTDDDAPPSAEWLQQYRQAAQAHPEYEIFAGPVVPRWPLLPASWISENVGVLTGAFAASNPGLREGPLHDMGHVSGANFAVRSELVVKHGFNSAIGPRSGTDYAMGSETEFLIRLTSAGYKTWWVEKAIVEHIIRPEQLSKAWVLERASRLGKGWCHQQSQWREAVQWFGVPRWLIRQLGAQAISVLRHSALGSEAQDFGARFEFLRTRSMLTESWRVSRSSKLDEPDVNEKTMG
jgi:L-malate glycosyltransferase